MGYAVHTDMDRLHMLRTIGAGSIAALFAQIPTPLREPRLSLPAGIDEQELCDLMGALAAADRPLDDFSFLGAGCYRHFVPAAVRALVSRGEFATSYTPYQPEVSQGTLEHIFEFQSCICELAGVDAANASLYDGGSALAEAAFMALRITGRDDIAISAGVHPEAAQIVATYASGPGIPVRRLPLDPVSGATRPGADRSGPTRPRPGAPAGVGALLVQQPNYLGIIEDLEPLAEAAHATGALLVVSVDPGILGVLESPGKLGADIVVGDAQVFGCPPSFGGPSVGFLACRRDHVRQIPGRLVSQTVDADGRLCYTLTLQTREQHIRRAKATSNICSNQALSALAATIHLALLGPAGLRERGEICLQRAHYLQSRLCALPGVRPLVESAFFHEFAVRLPLAAEEFVTAMRTRGVDPGVPLSRLMRWPPRPAETTRLVPSAADQETIPGSDPFLEPVGDVLLVAVTEMNPPHALDAYVAAAAEVFSTHGHRPRRSRRDVGR